MNIQTKTKSEFPELDEIAKEIADSICLKINHSVKNVKSKMPYKAQYVLEEVIAILKDRV